MARHSSHPGSGPGSTAEIELKELQACDKLRIALGPIHILLEKCQEDCANERQDRGAHNNDCGFGPGALVRSYSSIQLLDDQSVARLVKLGRFILFSE